MSLRETYQSRKNLLATNLRQKGVTASGTEGLTTLINKVLDINTISFDGITLNSDKDIISYNGGTQPESAVLTAQLTLDGDPAPVSGETVTFEVRKDSDDSLVETLTGTTNSSGVATVSYLGKGVGDLYVKAILRSFVSETYSIRDVHYYADYSKIKSSWAKDTSVSGRTIYSYLNNVTNGTVLFKVNNLPNSFIVGIGKYYNGGQIKDMFVRMNSQNQHWYSTNSTENQSVNISQTVTANSIFKFVITNSHTIAFYVDDVLVATTNTKTSFNPTLRIDDFTASPLDLEYVIIL